MRHRKHGKNQRRESDGCSAERSARPLVASFDALTKHQLGETRRRRFTIPLFTQDYSTGSLLGESAAGINPKRDIVVHPKKIRTNDAHQDIQRQIAADVHQTICIESLNIIFNSAPTRGTVARSVHMKKLLIILVALVVLAGVGIGGALYATSGLTDAASAFFDAVKANG